MKNFLKHIKETFKLSHCSDTHGINLDNVIKKLKKKYQNKRIVVYGAGLYATEIFEKYDLCDLNIIAVTDMKYPAGLNENKETFCGHRTLNPNDLFHIDFDVILITILFSYMAEDTLNNIGLKCVKSYDTELLQEKGKFAFAHRLIESASNKLKLDYIERIEL